MEVAQAYFRFIKIRKAGREGVFISIRWGTAVNGSLCFSLCVSEVSSQFRSNAYRLGNCAVIKYHLTQEKLRSFAELVLTKIFSHLTLSRHWVMNSPMC
jgi:hypothetical protein